MGLRLWTPGCCPATAVLSSDETYIYEPSIFSFMYKSRENQVILQKLMKEVKGQNPNFNSQHIRGKRTT